MNAQFEKVFSPFKLKHLQLPNRIVLPPMAIYVPGSKGFVTKKLVDYYEARAKGGVGYIIVNATVVSSPSGSSHPNQTAITDDKFIPGMKQLTDAIHKHGIGCSLQFHHAGRQRFGMVAGGETMSPSGIPDPVRKDATRAMTIPEIHALIEEYGDAARRAKEAGFDGIEIHCAHGYLLAGFLSPFQNQRDDEYGGDVWRRTRIVREILQRCRDKAGDDMLLGVRINGHDYVNGGNTLEDAKEIAKILVDSGAEVIHVSAGMAPSGHYSFLPAHIPQGQNVYLAEGVKEAVGADVPVIAVGAIEDIAYAEEVLQRGTVDLVAIGRPLFADPEMVNKAKEGRLKEIRPCLRCSKSAAVWPEDMRCTVNAAIGREVEFEDGLIPVENPKDVLVVGAGPGGLEAARIAAIRGHKVTVVDAGNEIGGKIHLAKLPPKKDRLMEKWVQYYRDEVERLGIGVELNKEMSADEVIERQADVVIIATGGKPLFPRNIKGVDLPEVVSADDVLWGKVDLGKRIAIIGGSSLGVETAEYILEEPDRSVVVIEMLHDILLDISHDSHVAMLDSMVDKDWKYIPETMVTAIEKKNGKMTLRVMRRGLESALEEFDTVVMAAGVIPNNQLGQELQGRHSNVHLIGDCEAPGDFRKAVHDGANIAMNI